MSSPHEPTRDPEANAARVDEPQPGKEPEHGGAGDDLGRERWRATTRARALADHPERRPEFRSSSEIEIRDLYTPADVAELDEERDLGRPGEFPFTRGVQPTMYRGRLWTMRQYAGFSTAADTNQRFRYLLEKGQTGLSVAFDLPTQMGYDSDAVEAQGEVGRVGVPISSLADMETLLDGLPLDTVSLSMTINATAPILLAFALVAAERRGIPRQSLSGTLQNDLLKEYIARGTYIYPPRQSMRLVTDVFEFCSTEMPRWNTISISGYHIREAGSTAVQEVAFTLANAIAYVEAALARGLAIDDFAPRLSFFFNAHSNFFEEAAKFRAARALWAEIARDRFGAKDPRSLKLRFHTQTAGSTLTAQQPEVNVVRVALQALSAVLGGAQSLHTNSKDEALALPTEDSARLALRTQQVIASESGVADVVDPLGGSFLVEAWTQEIRDRARALIDKVDAIGGSVAAIEQGFFQREIEDAAYTAQREIEEGSRQVVGVNVHREQNEAPLAILTVDPKIEEEQIARLRAFRASRDTALAGSALDNVRRDAREDRNLMPALIEAVASGSTLGEIVSALKEIYGEYRPGS